jgi:hypothetical protein
MTERGSARQREGIVLHRLRLTGRHGIVILRRYSSTTQPRHVHLALVMSIRRRCDEEVPFPALTAIRPGALLSGLYCLCLSCFKPIALTEVSRGVFRRGEVVQRGKS